MSTKKKKGDPEFSTGFFMRSQSLLPSRNPLMLTMRMCRELLASSDGKADHWIELAGLINVCGAHAQHEQRADWFTLLQNAADALREIEARHRRVGGRYAGKPAEVDAITLALNMIDDEILPTMSLAELTRCTNLINRIAALEPA